MNQVTVGSYLAQRLEEVGVRDYFAIPGDFNLSLLDEMLKNPRLQMINCCNELNAGYAADGYAREKSVAALLLTFGVGGLSAVNAVAGAFAEDLPVIMVSGGPNVSSLMENRTLHHTLAQPGIAATRCIPWQSSRQSWTFLLLPNSALTASWTKKRRVSPR
jgi:pyruvate decarboxylase